MQTQVINNQKSDEDKSQCVSSSVPTYNQAKWENIDSSSVECKFTVMQPELVEHLQLEPDPMFPCFDLHPRKKNKTQTKSSHAVGTTRSQQEEELWLESESIKKELKQKFEEGKIVGLQEAEKIAEAKMAESLDVLSKQLAEFTASISSLLETRIQEAEKQSVKLALEISRKIVEETAEVKPEYVVGLIRKGLRSLEAAKALKIRVSAQDYEFLEVVGMPSDLTSSELGVQYVVDENIKSGCIIDTDFGEVNLEIDSMWEEVKSSLFSICE